MTEPGDSLYSSCTVQHQQIKQQADDRQRQKHDVLTTVATSIKGLCLEHTVNVTLNFDCDVVGWTWQ